MKAREEAGKFLGEKPNVWKDLGSDEQKDLVERYMEHLRYTKNSTIAELLERDEKRDSVYELLRTKTKTILRKRRKWEDDNYNNSIAYYSSVGVSAYISSDFLH